MRNRNRLLLAMLAAACVLTSLASAAFARRLSISPGERGFRIVWAEFLLSATVGTEPVIHELTVRCPVTLEGTFVSSTFTKTARLQIGSITRAAVTEASCTSVWTTITEEGGGRARIERAAAAAKMRWLTETLPWAVQYRSFQGVLPVITAVNMLWTGMAFRVNELPIGSECLFQVTAANPIGEIAGVERSGVIVEVRADETTGAVPAREGNPFCMFGGIFAYGRGIPTQQESRLTLSLRLI